MNLILTYFDQIYGPVIYWKHKNIDDEVSDKIKNFIDLDLGETFFELTMVEQDLKTINLYVEIPSNWGRGRKEMVLLSVITDHNFKASLFQDILKKTSQTLISTKEIFKALYKNDDVHSNDPGVSSKFNELEGILNECVNDLNEMIKSASIGTLLFLGLGKVGKTTILERIRNDVFNSNTKPTLATTLIEAMIESYNFKIVDVSGQKSLRYQWWTYTTKPDAIIFVLDYNEKGARLSETKEELDNLKKRFDEESLDKKTPVLICANKIDLTENAQLEIVEEAFKLKKYNFNSNIVLTSAKTGDGIENGFKWLVNKLIQFS